MYTTSLAAIDYIKAHYPEAKRLFLLGTPSMISQFEKAGFESCADDPNDVPDVLVAAFDMTLEYSRLCRAAWWASQGVPYIATNPDRVCPLDILHCELAIIRYIYPSLEELLGNLNVCLLKKVLLGIL